MGSQFSAFTLVAKIIVLAQKNSSLLHKRVPIRANIGATGLF
jgi:hypothetical protein